MKAKLYYILVLITASGLSFNSFSQVPDIDSLQKKILESVRQGLDKEAFSNPYFDTSKIFSGKSPVNLDQLFRDINKDLKAARSEGDIDKLEKGYHHLSTLDNMRGNYRGAYENYKLYTLYRDSLQKKETENRELQAKMQYEFDKKQAIAKSEQAKKDAEAKRVKDRQYFTIAGLTILLLVILLIALIQWRNNNQKKKTNVQLQLQKENVESALSELRSTQTQLIHSEKMASLGELTAGIAHEIQNPLNFVNNFSEVSRELIDELKSQKEKLKKEDQDEILNDIDANLEKINHHGRRADAIVKGMLQHSRTSPGQKESTDINSLVDEYLRLSYHGIRAKDNNFHATIQTDFDTTIGEINIIPQDIGRALLNLYNNAFYAVDEKKNVSPGSASNLYEPIVSVRTKKSGNNVELTVKDNGKGIPRNIVDKIFQPFFTTKPTGQGTGLGLSLSYDIIKAHGGELKVKSEEGNGALFIIQIPITQ